MILEQALRIAERVKATLAPHCDRCEIAGSCRRKKSEPNDIEIVCIPKMVKTGLFGDETQTSVQFSVAVHLLGEVKLGKPEDGRYVRIWLPEQIQLDLFITTSELWGLIYAIRTGSSRFSHEVLAAGWSRKGYKSEGGILYPARFDRVHDKQKVDYLNPVFIREEIDLFDFLGLAYVEPEDRV